MNKSKNKVEIKTTKAVIEVSNPDKILFPKSKITKLEVVEYYRKISKKIIPY